MIAEKCVIEFTENNSETLRTVFEVQPDETVEALLRRMNVTGSSEWHYNVVEVRIKLVKPPQP